jgi:hypothetical protein
LRINLVAFGPFARPQKRANEIMFSDDFTKRTESSINIGNMTTLVATS